MTQGHARLKLQDLLREVEEAARDDRCISDAVAREIARSWMGPLYPAINTLAQQGIVQNGLNEEIEATVQRVRANPRMFEDGPWLEDVGGATQNIAMLQALLNYIRMRTRKG